MINQPLFDQLRSVFGDVILHFPDRPAGMPSGQNPTVVPAQGNDPVDLLGEAFQVQCPYCRTASPTLYIGHEFGSPSAGPTFGMTAAMCRRGCLERPDRQEDLRRYVADQSLRRNVFRLEVEPILLPATMVPVDQLPSDHRARRYIEDRGFDPAELAAKWQVGYCDRCISAKPDIRDRIVVPVYGAPGFIDPNPRLAGWLARAVEESGGAPKYLNAQGFKKSKLVYRAPVFGRSDALVVVEGCTDAWRVGVHAVAVLGKKISAAQRFAIRTLAVGRPIVLMLDADAAREAGQARRELLAERRHDGGDVRVLLATLPPGRKDPGECTRAELEEVLAVALSGSPCHA